MKLTMELGSAEIQKIIRDHFDPTGEHEVKVDLNLRRHDDPLVCEVASTVVLNTLATKSPAKPSSAQYRVKCLEPAMLKEMFAAAKGYVMSSEEREAQRQSWARGQAALGECEAERHQTVDENEAERHRMAYVKERLGEARECLAKLSAIADRYETNDLDECRPQWSEGLEHDLNVVLFSGRGGGTLFTLQDCFNARKALKSIAALGECAADRHPKLCVYTVVDKKGDIRSRESGVPVLFYLRDLAELAVRELDQGEPTDAPHQLVTLFEVRRER